MSISSREYDTEDDDSTSNDYEKRGVEGVIDRIRQH